MINSIREYNFIHRREQKKSMSALQQKITKRERERERERAARCSTHVKKRVMLIRINDDRRVSCRDNKTFFSDKRKREKKKERERERGEGEEGRKEERSRAEKRPERSAMARAHKRFL